MTFKRAPDVERLPCAFLHPRNKWQGFQVTATHGSFGWTFLGVASPERSHATSLVEFVAALRNFKSSHLANAFIVTWHLTRKTSFLAAMAAGKKFARLRSTGSHCLQ